MSGSAGPVGTVAGRELSGALLDARLAELRSGPAGDLLPPAGTLEGRRLRRWVAQLVLTEELVRVEAARLGVSDPGAADDRGVAVSAGPQTGTAGGPDPWCGHAELAEWRTGSLASAVLAAMPLARLLYRTVTAEVHVDDAQARDYYQRNRELWAHSEKRTLLHVHSAQPPDLDRLRNDGAWWTCARDELPEPLAKLAFSAAPGAIVGPVNTPFGWQMCLVGRVTPAVVDNFATVRDQIVATLTRSARKRYFERWIEWRRSELVAVAVGCEHPGDPRHSDYTHHH